MILTQGLNRVKDLVGSDLTTGGVGINSTLETVSDTGLFGAGLTLNACDATTGWAASGDGATPIVNSVAGEFAEGTACLRLPFTYSAGSALYTCALGSTNDLRNKKVVCWVYVASPTSLNTGNAIRLYLGTGGTTNVNIWNFDKTIIATGWNSFTITANSPDTSSGTGATTSSITNLALYVAATATQASNALRTDYWRYYSPNQLGVTDSLHTLTKDTTSDRLIKTIHTVAFTESNGLTISEAGDNNGATVYNRYTFVGITKDDDRELRIDKYYYIEGD